MAMNMIDYAKRAVNMVRIGSWIGKLDGVAKLLSHGDIQMINSRLAVAIGHIALEGVLSPAHFANFQKFAQIISILNTCKISASTDLPIANVLVAEFIQEFNEVYPSQMHRYNMHK